MQRVSRQRRHPSGLRSNPEVQHPYGLGDVLLVLENGSDTFTFLYDSTQSFVNAGSVLCDYWVRICVNGRWPSDSTRRPQPAFHRHLWPDPAGIDDTF